MKFRGLLLLGTLSAFPAPAAEIPADHLVPIVERYENLHIAAESSRASNLRLASGHLDCLLTSGSIAYVKAGKGDAEYKSIVNHWRPGANLATDKAPIPLANRVYDASERRIQNAIRRGLLYEKGPLLLYALHKELGDQQFLTFLKSYQKSFRWKFGSTKTIASFLQFMTKKDYMPFFEANYWGTGMPRD